MSLIFFLKPHYGGGGEASGGGGEFKRQIQIYEESYYDAIQPKKVRPNPADIHPFFADRPELIPVVKGLIEEGFDLEEILLLFMMVED